MDKGNKKVEGYNNLYRNEKGAIVNTDSESYESYKRRSSAARQKNRKITALEEEIISTRQEIEELKELVKQLLDK